MLKEKTRPNANKTPLSELGIRPESYGCLYRAGVRTIGEVMRMTPKEIKSLNGIGKKSYKEIMQKLNAFIKEE